MGGVEPAGVRWEGAVDGRREAEATPPDGSSSGDIGGGLRRAAEEGPSGEVTGGEAEERRSCRWEGRAKGEEEAEEGEEDGGEVRGKAAAGREEAVKESGGLREEMKGDE